MGNYYQNKALSQLLKNPIRKIYGQCMYTTHDDTQQYDLKTFKMCYGGWRVTTVVESVLDASITISTILVATICLVNCRKTKVIKLS